MTTHAHTLSSRPSDQQRHAANGHGAPLPGQVEVAVIGAGQTGLAVSYYLTQQGRDHIVLEQADQLAQQWRHRWDSFTLVTPNFSLHLPGFPYQGDDPEGFLTRDEVVRYFEDYAAFFNAPVRFGVTVSALDAGPGGDGFLLTTSCGQVRAANVVVATGAFQHPKLPAAAADMPPGLLQIHSSQYQNPAKLPPGAVLVAGTSQSGAQIAADLYESGRTVYLSVSGAGRAPRRYRGHDVFWWMERLGVLDRVYAEMPEPKRRYAASAHLSGKDGGRTLNLHRFARDGVHLLGRIQGVAGDTLHLAPDLHESLAKADAEAAQLTRGIDHFIAQTGIDAPPADPEPTLRDGFDLEPVTSLDLAAAGITSVVWATGYSHDFGWIHMPVLDDGGYPVQERGVTAVPGLFFIGLLWMHKLRSGLIGGAGEDAAYLAEAIAACAGDGRHHARPPEGAPVAAR